MRVSENSYPSADEIEPLAQSIHKADKLNADEKENTREYWCWVFAVALVVFTIAFLMAPFFQ
jgi:hypothetical protein